MFEVNVFSAQAGMRDYRVLVTKENEVPKMSEIPALKWEFKSRVDLDNCEGIAGVSMPPSELRAAIERGGLVLSEARVPVSHRQA